MQQALRSSRSVISLMVLFLIGCSQAGPRLTQTGVPLAPTLTPSMSTQSPSVAPLNIEPTTSAMPTLPTLATSSPQEQVVPTATMSVMRAVHTATLLPNGQVLIAGGCVRDSCEVGEQSASAELYDPQTGMFKPTGGMAAARLGGSATLLQDGRVLLVGGWNQQQPTATAELYDPRTGSFTSTGTMHTQRGGHSDTLLPNGQVLIAGGYDGRQKLSTAELYDPHTGSFAAVGQMATPRDAHSASLLRDGRVLIAGGSSGRGTVVSSAELYDPVTSSFAATGQMTVVRHKHAAVTLPNGNVLIVGGSDARDGLGQYATTELYNPTSGRFQAGARMRAARFKLPTSTALLPNGEVLVAGSDARVEIYNVATATFRTVAGSLGADRAFSTATLLPGGEVLIAGGYDGRIRLTANAWVYRP